MKLCPQCEFIYEDDQSVCDMDGKELVFDPVPMGLQEAVPVGSPEPAGRFAAPIRVTVDFPTSRPSRSRGSAFAALAAILLVTLLFVVYYARTHQARSADAKPATSESAIQSSTEATQLTTAAPEASPDLSASLAPSPDPSSAVTTSPAALPVSAAANVRERMLTNPVAARASGAESRAPVIVWLRNGTSIKADEAWEKREGVWYRQGGVVTFLKRGQVRSIQRLQTPGAYAKSTPIKGTPDTAIAQNQPRAYKADVTTTKKDSRVGSFLKRTGRILKKPFKL